MNFVLILKHVLFGGGAIYAGILLMKYARRVVLWFGTADFAESYVPGGTTSLLKIIGFVLVFVGIYVLFGYAKLYGI